MASKRSSHIEPIVTIDSRVLPVGIVGIDGAGAVVSWNPAAEEILGWRSDEVVGRPPPVEFPAEGIEQNVTLQRKDGSGADVQVKNLGTFVIICDLGTHREESRFRELLELAPDAIIEIDPDGRIVLLNEATQTLFGYERNELLGQPVEILIPGELRAEHRGFRKDYAKRPATRPMGSGLSLEGLRKDGARIPVEISLSPKRSKGGVRVTAIIRDVRERRRAEEKLLAVQARYTEELAAKNRELEARNAEVERANSLKSEFLSGMSHELRTPLHTIIGFAELLAEKIEGPLTEKQERFVGHVIKDSQHLLALINDVLDLSKIESGRLELYRENFNLGDALQETLASIRLRAESKSVRLETHLAGPSEIFADRLRLRQILYNLLSNAVKFTPGGGRVWVDARPTGEAMEITVGDSGVGIPPEEHEAVFDKFYQVGQRQAKGHEGTGLGLAITRRLVQEHGGTITLESEVGQGSRFKFTIPV